MAIGYAHAQVSFELEYASSVEHLVELPSPDIVEELSDYELTTIESKRPVRSVSREGYAPGRGLYSVTEVKNPRENVPEWRRRVAAKFVDEGGELVTYDASGTELARIPFPLEERHATYRQRLASAERGRLRPYRPSVMPSALDVDEWRDSGYEVLGRGAGGPITARSGPEGTPVDPSLEGTLLQSIGANRLGRDWIGFRSATELHVYDSSGTQHHVEYAPDGTPIRFSAQTNVRFDLPAGGSAYVPALHIESHLDTLMSGVVVVRSRVERRSSHRYSLDGEPVFGAGAETSTDRLSVFPNPLLGRRLSIVTPAGLSSGARLVVRDASGRLLYDRTVRRSPGATLTVDLPGDTASGVLSVELTQGDRTWQQTAILF